MPQRSNIVGDLGTTKVASDSYDIDNIYLTEEGWVYRHYKKTDKSKWWDEIIVAGQVDEATNEPCAETNPPKLGTIQAPTFESGGDTYKDFEYSTQTATGGGVPTFDNTPAPPDTTPVTIGTVSLDNTTATATEADVVTYVASYDGDAPTDQVRFDWIIANASVTGGSITSDTVTVTFDEVATAGVQCSVTGTDSSVSDGPTAVTLNVVVSAAAP